jgi:hypothetical protein
MIYLDSSVALAHLLAEDRFPYDDHLVSVARLLGIPECSEKQ